MALRRIAAREHPQRKHSPEERMQRFLIDLTIAIALFTAANVRV